MSKPILIPAGNVASGVRVEYVKCRKVLRFSGTGMSEKNPVEIHFPQLVETLATDATLFAAPVRYLLFGGLQRDRRGGTRDIVGVFDSEAVARGEFLERRLRRPGDEEWAELVALDGRGRFTRLGWFGMDQRATSPGSRRKGALRRLVRIAAPVRSRARTAPLCVGLGPFRADVASRVRKQLSEQRGRPFRGKARQGASRVTGMMVSGAEEVRWSNSSLGDASAALSPAVAFLGSERPGDQ